MRRPFGCPQLGRENASLVFKRLSRRRGTLAIRFFAVVRECQQTEPRESARAMLSATAKRTTLSCHISVSAQFRGNCSNGDVSGSTSSRDQAARFVSRPVCNASSVSCWAQTL